ncbi:Uncharacterised protein [Serratia liquefaciens]|jgi:hypothetical protein|nr:Uncharacterised protein [Serratia liquefaciens]CAI1701571.1 Uncharacterised protein [Serratia liquefaciens]CAI2129235.1 Uncharacterised protein [Serratia liquefaciens]CAI2483982.1 Uncharacterised protein [Serratia liquefaciens]
MVASDRRIARLELDGLFPLQPEGLLQLQTHLRMGITPRL